MLEFDILIIGGGPALRNCVKAVRWLDKEARIGCIRRDKTMINHCAMPYVLDRSTTLNKVIIPDEIVTSKGAELFVDEARKIYPERKTVKTANGEFKYRKLFLMTGSSPLKPSWEGVDLENIFTLRRTEDIERLNALLNGGNVKNIVIVGGGYIGVEFAYLLAKRGGLNISLIEALPSVMQASFDDEFCRRAEEALKKGGVNLYLNSRVQSFAGTEKVERVVLDGGKHLAADVVILAIGVKPEVELALEGGLKGDKNGIEVDKYMQTSEKDIYAAGDAIKTLSAINQEPFPGRLGSNAVVEAKAAVLNAYGIEREFPGVVNPSGTKVFGVAFGSCGFTERYLKAKGIDYVTGYGKTTSIYSMLPESCPVEAKMIFSRDTLRLLGVQIAGGPNIAGYVDMAAYSIMHGGRLEDFLGTQFTTQPELSPQPRANVWASCAEDAWLKLK